MDAICKTCGAKVWLDVIRSHSKGTMKMEVAPKKCGRCGHSRWEVVLDFYPDVGDPT